MAIAAQKLGVPAVDLRWLIWAKPALTAAVREKLEQAMDEATAVAHTGMKNPGPDEARVGRRRLARLSEAGRRRWGV